MDRSIYIDIHPDFIFVPEAMDIGTQRDHVVKGTNLVIARVVMGAVIVWATVATHW